ncbi:MAG: BrnT family toxin [Deltaproteobacteria bacterium]|nr:BrnT family toxin [Deltaproteobacteria bacterium]MCZ6906565.1 BrnT family toxin [Deltaproteobacteria bacterium]
MGLRKIQTQPTKTRISFEEASTAFLDPDGLDGEDLEHSSIEARQLRLAKSGLGKVLIIAYTIRRRGHEKVTRIICARRANRKGRKIYQEKED